MAQAIPPTRRRPLEDMRVMDLAREVEARTPQHESSIFRATGPRQQAPVPSGRAGVVPRGRFLLHCPHLCPGVLRHHHAVPTCSDHCPTASDALATGSAIAGWGEPYSRSTRHYSGIRSHLRGTSANRATPQITTALRHTSRGGRDTNSRSSSTTASSSHPSVIAKDLRSCSCGTRAAHRTPAVVGWSGCHIRACAFWTEGD